MATSDDILRINPIVHEIARLLFEYTNSKLPGANTWGNSLLDVRFDERDGFTNKIRVTRPSEEVVSLTLPTQITLQLIELNRARPMGQDRWYGCKLEVTSAGGCQVDFNYDPACTNDPTFFTS